MDDDDAEALSQTSTVFTHESRIFSLENVGSQEDTALLNIKVESQNSPRSPSLLHSRDTFKLEPDGIQNGDSINPNLLVASHDSFSEEIHLSDCNISSNSQGSDFILDKPEATWVRENAFINLSTPWIQRNEAEQRRCVSFFSDLINKATGESPVCLILPIILQLKQKDRLNIMNLLNGECSNNNQDANSDIQSPNQELIDTDVESDTEDALNVQQWVNATSLSGSILSRIDENDRGDIGQIQHESSVNNSEEGQVTNLQICSTPNDNTEAITNINEVLDSRLNELTPEKVLPVITSKKTPKKKADQRDIINSPIKRIKTRLTFETGKDVQQNAGPFVSPKIPTKESAEQIKVAEVKIGEKVKSYKKKSNIKCKIDTLREVIPDSNRFETDSDFLEAFSFVKTCTSSSSSKTCSICESKDGMFFEMFYYQYENSPDSVKEHHTFCPDCFLIFKQLKDVKKLTLYEMIYDLTYNSVMSQYESMLSTGNVRFRIRSRKRWFENLKLHFEDLKNDVDITMATGKHQGGILIDVVTSNKIKDDIRSEVRFTQSSCYLTFACYLYEKASKAIYKFELKQLGNEKSGNNHTKTNFSDETLTPNKKQTGLTRYFRPI